MGSGQIGGISVFFPAFNDEQSIGDLVRKASDTVRELTDDVEIIVVNDGSRDQTADRLAELQMEMPALRVVTHETNRGYGAALRSGFTAATKEYVFYTDGDGQYDVREFAKLARSMTDDVDVVNGFKLNRADGLHRKFFGKVYARATRLAFRLPIRDVDCDFRLMRRQVLNRVELTSSSGAICVELVSGLARHGARFAEVGVNHYTRQAGRSQFFSPSRIFGTLVELAALWLRGSQSAEAPKSGDSEIDRMPVRDK